MTTISFRHQQDRARAAKFKRELLAARRELAALKKQLTKQYDAGSAATFGLFFAALDYDPLLQNWLTNKIDKLAGREPSPLPARVLNQLLDDLRRSGITEIRLEDIA